jgi:hypothetical protein
MLIRIPRADKMPVKASEVNWLPWFDIEDLRSPIVLQGFFQGVRAKGKVQRVG